ncbi:MAG TPA: hypothetical protein VMM92_16480 [Thermoanaerobaculia bacterium]|nr:hypothetical protein [Thermoanaerobaculia bacterium]
MSPPEEGDRGREQIPSLWERYGFVPNAVLGAVVFFTLPGWPAKIVGVLALGYAVLLFRKGWRAGQGRALETERQPAPPPPYPELQETMSRLREAEDRELRQQGQKPE